MALPASDSDPSAPLNSCILPNTTANSTTLYSGLLVGHNVSVCAPASCDFADGQQNPRDTLHTLEGLCSRAEQQGMHMNVQAVQAVQGLPSCCSADKGLHCAQCDGISGGIATQQWKIRCSFPVYVVALSAYAGRPPVQQRNIQCCPPPPISLSISTARCQADSLHTQLCPLQQADLQGFRLLF